MTMTSPFELPVIPSGRLFLDADADTRNRYFDEVAKAPAELVSPMAMYGRNGFYRMLDQTGMSEEDATRRFREMWAASSMEDRRNELYSNALARVVNFESEGRYLQAAVDDIVEGSRAVTGFSGAEPSDDPTSDLYHAIFKNR